MTGGHILHPRVIILFGDKMARTQILLDINGGCGCHCPDIKPCRDTMGCALTLFWQHSGQIDEESTGENVKRVPHSDECR